MTTKLIALLAIALALDSFAVSMGMGLARTGKGRFSAFVAIVILMHIVFPLAGLAIGNVSAAYIGQVAAYIGGGLLIFLGGRILLPMWVPKWKAKNEERVNIAIDGFGHCWWWR